MADVIRWGVIGASSRIYRGKLRPPMESGPRHRIVAEASRDADGGDQPYAELLARTDVDAVYIPLPNDGHHPWIMRALEAGKHVLCEKPLTMSPADTEAVFAAAAGAGRTLMEAYMWPHHPRNQTILAAATADLGVLQASYGTFSFPFPLDSGDHRLDARGGGALFDIGIYCLGPMALLAPREVLRAQAAAVRNAAGVDVTLSGSLDLGDGLVAHVTTSVNAPHRRSFDLIGTDGIITVDDWFAPGPDEASEVVVAHRDGTRTSIPCPGANAFANMIDQFADVANHGAAPVWGREESCRMARWLAALHAAAADS